MKPILGKWISMEVKRSFWTMGVAADKIGISRNTLYNLILGGEPELETLIKIANWAHVCIEDLVDLWKMGKE